MIDSIRFTEDQVKELAIFIVTLTKEEVSYNVYSEEEGWAVRVVGY